jgi:hypothetical protein
LTLIDPTPDEEFCFKKAIFEVALFYEPYYNPANLENAGICVKEKEFINQLGWAWGWPHTAHQ